MSATITCPHCQAITTSGAAFCESCGKAIPQTVSSSPRIVDTAGGYAQTSAGLKLQGEELRKQARKATGALLAVAIIFTAVSAFLVIMPVINAGNRVTSLLIAVAVIQGIICVVFWGLYFWARRQPLPAAIVGLCIYGTLLAFNVIVSVRSLSSGGHGAGGFGGIGIGWLDIVIIAVLVNAITAGVKYRKMVQQGLST